MAIERAEVAREVYKGRTIVVRFLGPDVIGEIDGIEMSNMFLSAPQLIAKVKKDIDEEENKASKERVSDAKKNPRRGKK